MIIEENVRRIEVTIECFGSHVYKQDVRRILNIPNHMVWLEEIELLKKEYQDFAEFYQSNARRKRLSIPLARTIIERIFGKTGEEIKVIFQFNDIKI